MLQPIPPYIHTKEKVLPKLTQEELQQNLQDYDHAIQTKQDQGLMKFMQQHQIPFQ